MTKKRTELQAAAAKRKADAVVYLRIAPTEFDALTVREWLAIVEAHNRANSK